MISILIIFIPISSFQSQFTPSASMSINLMLLKLRWKRMQHLIGWNSSFHTLNSILQFEFVFCHRHCLCLCFSNALFCISIHLILFLSWGHPMGLGSVAGPFIPFVPALNRIHRTLHWIRLTESMDFSGHWFSILINFFITKTF